MNDTVKELIAIGASVAGHCQPCLEYHLKAAAQLGISMEEIEQAVAIGRGVEKGAMAAMKNFSEAAVQRINASAQSAGAPKKLTIYDPALCCSSGVCGPSVDPALAAFAGTLKAIPADAGVTVERYNLGQQPQAFVENPRVKELLADGGDADLPFIFIDDELVFSARYPVRSELFAALGIPGATARDAAGGASAAAAGDAEPCCSGSESSGSCC